MWSQDGTYKVAVPAIGADLTGAVHIIGQYYQTSVFEGPVVYWKKPSSGAWPKPVSIQAPGGKQRS